MKKFWLQRETTKFKNQFVMAASVCSNVFICLLLIFSKFLKGNCQLGRKGPIQGASTIKPPFMHDILDTELAGTTSSSSTLASRSHLDLIEHAAIQKQRTETKNRNNNEQRTVLFQQKQQ